MSNNINIQLGITRTPPKKSGAQKSLPNEELAALKKKIFARDNDCCRGCGFVAKKYQELHFLNGNPFDFREENLTTLCIFCKQCFDLEKVSEMRAGVLLWLPEIPQTTLHHIARSIYVARISQGPVAEAARKVLDIIMARRSAAQDRISTDDPYILSVVLRDYLGQKAYKKRDAKLDGMRLFPLDRRIIKEADLEFNQFPQILAYWRSKDGPYGGKAPPQWIPIYQELMAKTT